ncbi:hypothetical protein [Kineosporia succinea]|uniref:Type II secretory pathway pseudopilin PulG n=1 Tax=Kineosporia succinea TaxID=84632 RepID=A0ABT9NY06_9ACTN|nr:hypothetical protein [Kineosporia succinea]MDP9824880.1 type II secretory pathway pseudopilin PulG [Kineosporia succinea]
MHQQQGGGLIGSVRRGRVRRSTPNLLLVAGILVLGTALLAGVCGWQGLARRAGALEQARAEAGQQVRIQTARTTLVIADTDAGNDVLTGADPELFSNRLFAYDAQPALLGLVTAARTDADAARLATANNRLSGYVMQVATARTLARQGRTAEATAALTEASTTLHDRVLPLLAEVQKAGQDRLADDESAADTAPVVAVLVGILAVLVIIGVHLWLTRRTHRLLNLGLLSGIVVLIGVTIAGTVVVSSSREQVQEAEDHALRVADAVVEARFSAFDARSSEALGVLNRTTVDDEKEWRSSIDNATAMLEYAAAGQSREVRADVADVTGKLRYYTGVHERMVDQAEAGNWTRARAMTANPAPGGVVGSFETFDAYSGALLARQVQAADDAWGTAGEDLRLVGWITLAVGVLAAALGWAGIAARRREYR